MFLNVKYTFHQICNSDFINQDWFDYLQNAGLQILLYADDFRGSSVFMFQVLQTFCVLSQQTINNSLTQFYSTQFISSSVISKEVFELQIGSLITDFISSTTNNFLLSLSSIRQMTQSNALYSASGTNYLLIESQSLSVNSYPSSYGNCSCATSAKCAYQSPIRDASGLKISSVPGMYVGCYYVEALLQSDLRCFYNQTCISEIQSYFTASPPINVTALNSSLLIQFQVNSTMEDVVNKLMVDKWSTLLNYSNYYDACEPLQCIYTHETKNSLIYIVTTIIGLVGGLVTVLKLVVPRIIKLISSLIRKYRMKYNQDRVMPMVHN
ncbi:unnamed protein product [Adineta ricciae]|uniref:Uncharacterized protein n=1 Tax=Adineta ricciae TaxID=249248 RepID=A0A815Y188_ADIRI|nr:unnamed protein product [Adineta ricciae]